MPDKTECEECFDCKNCNISISKCTCDITENTIKNNGILKKECDQFEPED